MSNIHETTKIQRKILLCPVCSAISCATLFSFIYLIKEHVCVCDSLHQFSFLQVGLLALGLQQEEALTQWITVWLISLQRWTFSVSVPVSVTSLEGCRTLPLTLPYPSWQAQETGELDAFSRMEIYNNGSFSVREKSKAIHKAVFGSHQEILMWPSAVHQKVHYISFVAS